MKMGALLGILLIGGLVFAIWAIQTVIGKSVSTVDRAIRKKTLVAGRAEVHAGLSITAPIPPDALIPRIVSTVNAHAAAPMLVGGLYLKHRTDTLVQFALEQDERRASAQLYDYAPPVPDVRARTRSCTGPSPAPTCKSRVRWLGCAPGSRTRYAQCPAKPNQPDEQEGSAFWQRGRETPCTPGIAVGESRSFVAVVITSHGNAGNIRDDRLLLLTPSS
jgi:hypothetical protein